MQGMTRSDTELPETTTRAELGSQENNYDMQKKRDGGAARMEERVEEQMGGGLQRHTHTKKNTFTDTHKTQNHHKTNNRKREGVGLTHQPQDHIHTTHVFKEEADTRGKHFRVYRRLVCRNTLNTT